MVDLLRRMGLILFSLSFEPLISGNINNRFNRDLIGLAIAGLLFVAVGILSGRFQNPLNTGASPLDMPWCATSLLWSVASNQPFSNLWQRDALVVPFEYRTCIASESESTGRRKVKE